MTHLEYTRRLTTLLPVLAAPVAARPESARKGLGRYLARYVPEEQERALLESGTFDVELTHYDWSLNAVR